MLNRRRYLLLMILLSLMVLAGVPGAQAQQPITLDILTITLWPEFDDPSMLVFFSGRVSEDVSLPVELRFPLPPDVRVNAVAVEGPSGLLSTEYDVEAGELVMTTENGTFHIEFYDPALDRSEPTRAYILNWTLPYEASQLAIEAQQPVEASGLLLEPNGEQYTDAQTGLSGLRAVQEDVPAGERISIAVAYRKDTDQLSVDLMQSQQPVDNTGSGVNSSGPSDNILAYVLIGVAVLLIGGGIVWYVLTMREVNSPKTKKRSSKTRSGGSRFCTQCGKTVSSNDKFCRHCGAKLR